MNRDNFIPSRLRVQSIGVGFPAPLTNGDAKVNNITVVGTATVGTVAPVNVSASGWIRVGGVGIPAPAASGTVNLNQGNVYDNAGALVGAVGVSSNVNVGGSATKLGLRAEQDGLEISCNGGVIAARMDSVGGFSFDGLLEARNTLTALGSVNVTHNSNAAVTCVSSSANASAAFQLGNSADGVTDGLTIGFVGSAGGFTTGACYLHFRNSISFWNTAYTRTAVFNNDGSAHFDGPVGVTVDGVVQQLGFRHLPIPPLNITANYTLVQSDNGKGLAAVQLGVTVTLPALENGTIVTLINASNGAITLVPSAGGNIFWYNGSSNSPGNRTLAHGGVVTLWQRGDGSTSQWHIWGLGLS